MSDFASTPLLSVVIPTYKRPHFLPRAIDSALNSTPDGDVEVIVVPNGSDESWRDVERKYRGVHEVLWHPISTAHANAARNHGLGLARGKYVRFLDDDDYLLPGAAKQLVAMEQDGSDVCSGLIQSVDFDGTPLGLIGCPVVRDFLCAAVGVSGFRLPVGNLFLRKALAGCQWDINVHRAQDYAWMIDLAGKREWQWTHLDEQVGVWFQHDQTRTSSTARLTSREEAIVHRLLGLHDQLVEEGRVTAERSQAISEGLWYYVHRGFPNHPLYWSRIGRYATRISASAKPDKSFFREGVMSHFPPIVVEWLLFPLRVVSQGIKAVQECRGVRHYRRQL